MSIVVVATVQPKPESREQVRAALLAAVPKVHEEPGCERYSVQEDDEGFVFVERWADPEALETHNRGANLQELVAAVGEHLAGPLQVRVLTALPVGDPDKGAV